MDVSLFDYVLPPERIAQEAVEPRDAARLLVVDEREEGFRHLTFRDLPERLDAGDLLVVNDTRVIPARLVARKATGGRVEVFLLERREAGAAGRQRWSALIGASRAPRPGAVLECEGGLRVLVAGDPSEGAGQADVELSGVADVSAWLDAHGRPPLPPYIRRTDDDPRLASDRERYQTVFASRAGAVAAPTAGLHFTPRLLARLEARGVGVSPITLHVGAGTFRPVRERRTEDIRLHEEVFCVPEATARAIARTRARDGRVVAVGTTVTRALESCPEAEDGGPRPGAGRTSIFISPGHRFRHLDGLVTNFHLPRSTLLMLVAAFAGRERVLAAYDEAIRLGYRFYSYGDAMCLLRPAGEDR